MATVKITPGGSFAPPAMFAPGGAPTTQAGKWSLQRLGQPKPQGPQAGGRWDLRGLLRRPAAPRFALPEQAAPAPSAAAPPSYDDAYNTALERSRSGIDKQFELALRDIAQREQASRAAIGGLGGQLTDIYGRGGEALAAASGQLDAAQQASGVTSFLPASAQMAPLLAAAGMDLSARQADIPLLQLAAQTETARQRAAIENARLEAEQGLGAEQRGYLQELAREERQRSAEAGMLPAQQAAADREFQQKLLLKEIDRENKLASLVDEGTGMLRSDIKRIRKTGTYQAARKQWKGGASPQKVYDSLRGYPDTLRVLATEWPALGAIAAAEAEI